MNILIDIGHPGHVHLFRNLYFLLIQKHQVTVTVKKNLHSAIKLLTLFQIPYKLIGYKKDGIISKAFMQLYYDIEIIRLIKKYNINLGIGTSINIAHASRLTKMKSIVLDDDDDEVQPLFTKFAHPFCDVLLSPSALEGKRKKKDTVYYPGFHELAYLHPSRFTPDENVLKEAGLELNDKYFLLRFNSFRAHHDIGIQGVSIENKQRIVNLLKKYGRVFITTERDIDPEFREYQIKIEPHKIHSFMNYASMFIGDSQTMTSEAAVLGVPSIRSNSFVGRISYLEEEEHKYGLTFGFLPEDSERMFNKIDELLNMQNLRQEWQSRRKKLLKDKIDVTAFLAWFVENYPQTQIIRDNPDFFNSFN